MAPYLDCHSTMPTIASRSSIAIWCVKTQRKLTYAFRTRWRIARRPSTTCGLDLINSATPSARTSTGSLCLWWQFFQHSDYLYSWAQSWSSTPIAYLQSKSWRCQWALPFSTRGYFSPYHGRWICWRRWVNRSLFSLASRISLTNQEIWCGRNKFCSIPGGASSKYHSSYTWYARSQFCSIRSA